MCPFCNGKGKVKVGTKYARYFVRCMYCGGNGEPPVIVRRKKK